MLEIDVFKDLLSYHVESPLAGRFLGWPIHSNVVMMLSGKTVNRETLEFILNVYTPHDL